jgi:hypothetical protein
MNSNIGYQHSPRYLVGDLVRPISKVDRRDQVGIVVGIERTIGKLSNAVPYSYLVKWADNTTSEWGGSSIELAKEE